MKDKSSLIKKYELADKCKYFSKGDETLEQLLLVLNNQGYKTYKSGIFIDNGYIGFEIPDEKIEEMSIIIPSLVKNNIVVDISRYNDLFDGTSCIISYRKKYDKLRFLCNAFTSIKGEKDPIIERALLISKKLKKMFNDLNFGFKIYKSDKGIKYKLDNPVSTVPFMFKYNNNLSSVEKLIDIYKVFVDYDYRCDKTTDKNLLLQELDVTLKKLNKIEYTEYNFKDYYDNLTISELSNLIQFSKERANVKSACDNREYLKEDFDNYVEYLECNESLIYKKIEGMMADEKGNYIKVNNKYIK